MARGARNLFSHSRRQSSRAASSRSRSTEDLTLSAVAACSTTGAERFANAKSPPTPRPPSRPRGQAREAHHTNNQHRHAQSSCGRQAPGGPAQSTVGGRRSRGPGAGNQPLMRHKPRHELPRHGKPRVRPPERDQALTDTSAMAPAQAASGPIPNPGDGRQGDLPGRARNPTRQRREDAAEA